MQCTNCGAQLPDGSRFCPQCGTRLPLSAPEEIKFDRPARESDAASAGEDRPDPGAGLTWDPAIDQARKASHEAAVKAAETSDAAPSAEEKHHHHRSRENTFVSQDFTRRGDYDPAGPSQPIYKRWWFWVLIGLAAAFMIAAMVYAARNADRSVEDIPDPTPEPVEVTETPEPTQEPAPTEEPAPALSELWDLTGFEPGEADSPEALTEALDAWLTQIDQPHEITAGDEWLDIRLWKDGTHRNAEAAVDGDEDALAAWQALLTQLTGFQAQLQDAYDAAGEDALPVRVDLRSDAFSESTLSLIAAGEVYYDAVTGVDRLDQEVVQN